MTRILGFRQEQRGVALAMIGALVTTIIVLGAAAMADRNAAPIPFDARLQSAIQADLFVIAWLAAAIANVARLRFLSERDIAGSSSGTGSGEVRVAGAILQNTLEQVGLAIVTNLIVAATFSRSVAVTETLAGLFAIGRILFWVGYKHGARGRAFGFALTFYPSIVALVSAATALLFRWAS